MLKGSDLLYHTIEKYIDDQISSGTLRPGDKLLSERKIGELFDASLIPVRRAMQKFLDAGVLEKVQGKGTFVRKVTRTAPVLTGRIGVVYSHSKAGFFASPFYAAVFTGVEEQAMMHRQSLMMRSLVAGFNDNPDRMFAGMAPDVDGFLVVDLTPGVYAEVKEAMARVEKPLVILNYEEGPDGIDRIVTASRDNITKMVRHLAGLGHTRIACLYATHDGKIHANFKHRVQAFREAMAAEGLAADDSLLVPVAQSGDHRKLAARIMAISDRPTGLVCCGAYIALRYLYPQLEEMGVGVPDEMSITAYDDLLECGTVTPGLTAIDTPLEEMGRLGMKRLREKIAGDDGNGRGGYEIVLPGNLVVRGSTASPARKGTKA